MFLLLLYLTLICLINKKLNDVSLSLISCETPSSSSSISTNDHYKSEEHVTSSSSVIVKDVDNYATKEEVSQPKVVISDAIEKRRQRRYNYRKERFLMKMRYREKLGHSTDRQYVNSKEQLELTKQAPILTVDDCNRDGQVAIFIHSSGNTSDLYYNRRQVIRRTWAQDLIQYNISMYFVLALNPDQTVNEQLRIESETYQDIIQFPFIDNYRNLTLKAISVLRWITDHCNYLDYILKMDDDVIVNVELLVTSMDKMRPGFNGIVYTIRHGLMPNRDESSKFR